MRKTSQSGFTLMEILIAMTVLMIGMLPMLAVFRTALANLNRAIEDTYASAIAQSVIDALRLGLKDMKIEYDEGGNVTTKVIIFDHDGVLTGDTDNVSDLEEDRRGWLGDPQVDVSSPANKSQLLTRSYAIVLPRETEVESIAGSKPIGRAFLYPRKSPGDNAARKGADFVAQEVEGADGKKIKGRKVRVEKIYKLGQKLKDSNVEIENTDALPQYGFAFTIRSAKAPDPLAPTVDAKQQDVLKGLYEVVIMVYRNFNPDPNNRRNDTVGGPGREFITYLAE